MYLEASVTACSYCKNLDFAEQQQAPFTPGQYVDYDCVLPLGTILWILVAEVQSALVIPHLPCIEPAGIINHLRGTCKNQLPQDITTAVGDGYGKGVRTADDDGCRRLQLLCRLMIPKLLSFAPLQSLLYFVLAVYLDNVLANESGVQQRPWYFLLPSYWGLGGRGSFRRAHKEGMMATTMCGLFWIGLCHSSC